MLPSQLLKAPPLGEVLSMMPVVIVSLFLYGPPQVAVLAKVPLSFR